MRIADILKGRWAPLKDPVLNPGRDEDWDGLSVITPGIFPRGVRRKYGMFYVGLPSGSDTWGIGYAESNDLLRWEKSGANPLIRCEDAASSFSYDSPCLVRRNGTYHLFLEEKRFKKNLRTKLKYGLPLPLRLRLAGIKRRFKGTSDGALSVRHAADRHFVSFSSSALLDWKMESRRAVLREGGHDGFDRSGLFSPQVHEFEGRYYMFYGGSDGRVTSTGLAVSEDLVKWERAGSCPVLAPGGRGEWDEFNALIVSILKTEDGYCGFYEGEDANNTYRIGLAYSRNLTEWKKFKGNPVIETGVSGSFSEKMACSPHVLSDRSRVLLFYTGHDRNMRGRCGAAELKP